MRYNTRRPHEALGDRPPITCWTPSARPRPARLPEVAYDAGVATRRVCSGGNVPCQGDRFTAGAGLAGEDVAVEERDPEITLRYGHVTLKRISTALLVPDRVL